MRKENFISQHSIFALNTKLLFIVILLLATLITTRAQDLTSRPERGMSGKGTQQVLGLDSINLQNGSVSLALPLASLPSIAGGKLSYTLTAHYNSNLYNAYRSEKEGQGGPTGCQPTFSTETVNRFNSKGGWQIGGGYQVIFRDARDDYNYLPPVSQTCNGADYNWMQGFFFKPILVTPDGSEHEMRIEGSYETYTNSPFGQREHLRNYYRYTGTGDLNFSSPTRFYTTDGTYLSVIVNPPSSTIKWTIYMKDGTRVEQSADGQRTIDTNGNSILASINEAEGYGFIKDEQTGREIKFSAATYNNQSATKVEYQTVGGVWQTVWVVWGETTVQGKIYTKTWWNYEGNPTPPDYPGQTCLVYEDLQDTFSVVREIIMPATEQNVAPKKYTFSYNSDATTQATDYSVNRMCFPAVLDNYTRTVSDGLGELSEVMTPTGAEINYTYRHDGVHKFDEAGTKSSANKMLKNAITEKTITHDGTTDTWNYNIDVSEQATGGSVTNPDGSSYSETFPMIGWRGAGASGLGGLQVRSIQSGKIMTEKHWTLLGGVLDAFGSNPGFQRVSYNPVVDTEYTTLLADDGTTRLKMTAKKFQYDYNGELKQTVEYDWFDPSTVTFTYGIPTGVPTNATVLRVVNNSYYNQAADANDPNAYQKRSLGTSTVILGAPQETTIGDGTNVISKSQFSYDSQSYLVAPTLGNLTKVSHWLNHPIGQWIDATTAYDSYGNPTSVTDPLGNVLSVTYGDSTHANPTSVTVNPNNGTGAQTSTRTFDFSTGLILTETDVNGHTSTIDYTNQLLNAVDPFGRPGIVYSPTININGTNQRRSTTTFYEDNARRVRVEADVNTEGDKLLKSRTTADQLGRAILSETSEDGVNYTISSQSVYLNLSSGGMVTIASNPTRNNGATTDGWTRSTTDILGRVTEVATFSGSSQPPSTGGTTSNNSNFTGKVVTAYDLNTVKVTDQAGKSRKSVTNALGQLIKVYEDPDGVNFETNYSYDILGNLVKGVQGNGSQTQYRYFMYDSLSRLIRAKNPEQDANANLALTDSISGNSNWSLAYTYDKNGNLTSKTDARNTITNYTYDGLNRVTLRSYANDPTSTPSVTYTYDTGVSNAKGRLISVSSGVSTTSYTGYDALGRISGSTQTTDGTSYTMGYTYDLAGALVSQTYPSGRVVKNVYNSTGDLIQVFGKVTNRPMMTYANEFKYNAIGAVEGLRLGNNRWESTVFNSRLQPTQIALETTQNATDLLKLNYDYGNSDNNGNVKSQTITVPAVGANPGFIAIQSYSYDSLNRLTEAKETKSSVQQWIQTFTYDRYGNRTIDDAPNKTTPELVGPNPQISTTKNRIDPRTGEHYHFDSAGNMDVDKDNNSLVYDGDNKLVTYNGGATNGGANYVYDGDGKRVKKIVGNETTIFVYNTSGQMVAEYSTTAPPQTPETRYLTTDKLGSLRIITKANGEVKERHDYLPFGEEIYSLGGRISGLGYSEDKVRQKFTSYERDAESGLDFAQARYYSSKLGRFLSVDPENADAELAFPQSWNAYIYARNNPQLYTDPSGETVTICSPNGKDCYPHENKDFANLRKHCESSGECKIVDDRLTGGRIFVNGELVATFGNELDGTQGGELVAEGRRQFPRAGRAALTLLGGGAAAGACIGAGPLCVAAAIKAARTVGPAAVKAAINASRKACFVAGTLILTETGLKPIEEIKEGDKVLSYNEKTKQTEYKTVVQTMVREVEAGRILSLKVEGETEPLGVTGEHPFYVRIHKARDNTASEDDEGEWREAKDLRIGDEIRKADGTWAKVESINQQSEGAKVYNFEVEDNHNYFVGQTGLLVHNNCIQQALKSAKPVGDRLEATLKDGSKVIFRKDFGSKSHPIGSKYPNPVDHYNVEIHVPYRSGYKVALDAHIIVDKAGKVIDMIIK